MYCHSHVLEVTFKGGIKSYIFKTPRVSAIYWGYGWHSVDTQVNDGQGPGNFFCVSNNTKSSQGFWHLKNIRWTDAEQNAMISPSLCRTHLQNTKVRKGPYFIDEEIEAHIDDTDLAEQKLWWD